MPASIIAVVTKEGYYKAILCDYWVGVGYTLNKYYNNYKKALQLVSIGDIDDLRETIEETLEEWEYRGQLPFNCKTIEELKGYAISNEVRYLFLFKLPSALPKSPKTKSIKWEENYWIPKKDAWQVIRL
jgi:hypothetical protein